MSYTDQHSNDVGYMAYRNYSGRFKVIDLELYGSSLDMFGVEFPDLDVNSDAFCSRNIIGSGGRLPLQE